MGLTYVRAKLSNPADPQRSMKRKLLVDSGAFYSVISKRVLEHLGIHPYTRETFTLADGSRIHRDVGGVLFTIDGHTALSPVIFGERGDTALIGVLVLEALGLTIDPRTGRLKRVPLLLV